MVKLHPVKSLAPVKDCDSPISPRASAPNRFRSQSYDRSVFGPDDCTKESGACACCMCSTTPLVIIPSGDPICSQYNITLRNVQEYVDGGLLKTLHEESFMIYRQMKCDGTCQIGIFAAIEVDDCAKGVVRAHENVTAKTDITVLNKPKAVQQRQTYMDPVMLFYSENNDVNAVVERIVSCDEPYETLGGDANSADLHHIWTVKDAEDICAIQRAFDSVEHMYIADGHHRTAAACKESARLTSGRAVNVAQSSRFLTALIFPDSHLSVLSYNRCVSAWPQGISEELFLEQISSIFSVEAVDECDLQSSGRSSPRPTDRALSCVSDAGTVGSGITDAESRSGSMDFGLRASSNPSPCSPGAPDPHADQHIMHMYVGQQWYRLHAEPLSAEEMVTDPLRGVGCQILMDRVLRPLLRTDDASSGAHMIYVDGREGSGGVARQVQAGNAVVGFLMSAVPAECIMRVADAGQLLPAKATFFDPKPMTNMLLRLLR